MANPKLRLQLQAIKLIMVKHQKEDQANGKTLVIVESSLLCLLNWITLFGKTQIKIIRQKSIQPTWKILHSPNKNMVGTSSIRNT